MLQPVGGSVRIQHASPVCLTRLACPARFELQPIMGTCLFKSRLLV